MNPKIELLHPVLRNQAQSLYEEANRRLTGRAKMLIVSTLRTFAEQDELYAQGRTKPGKRVTNAKGGQSLHNYGVAIDFALLIDGKTASWEDLKDFDGDRKADWMEGQVAVVTLNEGENRLNLDFLQKFMDALDNIEKETSANALLS